MSFPQDKDETSRKSSASSDESEIIDIKKSPPKLLNKPKKPKSIKKNAVSPMKKPPSVTKKPTGAKVKVKISEKVMERHKKSAFMPTYVGDELVQKPSILSDEQDNSRTVKPAGQTLISPSIPVSDSESKAGTSGGQRKISISRLVDQKEQFKKELWLQPGIPSVDRTVSLQTSFLRVLKPVIILGNLTGRLPIAYKKEKDGTIQSFQWSRFHPFSIYLFIMNVLLSILFIEGSWSYFSFYMNLPVGKEWSNGNRTKLHSDVVRRQLRGRHERIVYDRHSVVFLMTWCALLHNVISGWKIQLKRKDVINYFNFWIKSITVMNMDVTAGARLYILVCLGLCLGVAVFMFIFIFLQAFPSAVGISTLLAIIMGREYDPELLQLQKKELKPSFKYLQVFAKIVYLYLFVSSKCYIFCFMAMAKFLRNAFIIWNERIVSCVLKGSEYMSTKEGRIVYSILFRDHCALLDLIEGTDRVFSYILESFFGLHGLSFCFEIYFFIHSIQADTDESLAYRTQIFTRKYDWIIIGIHLTLHCILIVKMLKLSAGVADEAQAGLEVIRRKTMLGRRTDEELFFIMSMFSSYTSHKPIGISAAGYFVCNKSFIVAVFITVIGYFSIIYQFKPRFDFQREPQEISRQEIQNFLNILEKRVGS